MRTQLTGVAKQTNDFLPALTLYARKCCHNAYGRSGWCPLIHVRRYHTDKSPRAHCCFHNGKQLRDLRLCCVHLASQTPFPWERKTYTLLRQRTEMNEINNSEMIVWRTFWCVKRRKSRQFGRKAHQPSWKRNSGLPVHGIALVELDNNGLRHKPAVP